MGEAVGALTEQAVDVEVREYRVEEARIATVRGRFAKLAKKAEKLGVDAPALVVVREDATRYAWDARTDQKRLATLTDEQTWIERVYIVRVDGEAPRLPGGWRLAATLQHTEAGTAVRTVEGSGIDATAYRTVNAVCDHCRTSRNRRDTYVVIDDEGDTRQVGSNCIADFLGGTDPEAIAAYAGDLLSAVGDLEAGERMGGVRNRESVYLADFLAETVAAIEAHGWLSKTNARYDQTPTAYHAAENLFAGCQKWPACWKHDTSHRSNAPVTAEQKADADEVLDWCRDRFADRADLDDYEWNLSVTLLRDWIEPREEGLAASAVSYHRRALEKELKERARNEQRAAAGPAPRGREAVTGRIVKLQEYEGYMPGDPATVKMTVILDNGATVWATLPAAIWEAKAGDVVGFTATFEAGRNDPSDAGFAVGKRPSKATIIEAEGGDDGD